MSALFNPLDPVHLPPDPPTPKSEQAAADRIRTAVVAFEARRPAPVPPDAAITASVWAAYDAVKRFGYTQIVKPLPGWRVDRVQPDGTIGGYGPDAMRTGYCKGRTWLLSGGSVPWHVAVEHDPHCLCGYRIVKDVYTLLQFVADQSVLTQATEVPGLGEVRGVEGARYPMVLTRVLAHDSAAASAKRHNDPTGTIRVPRTQLVEVFLPRLAVTGDPIPAGLARKIRARYPGVVVRCIPGNIYDFQGTRDTSPPYGWPTSLYIVAENTQRYMDTSRTNAA